MICSNLFFLQTWNPRSKTEPYAQSAVELMKLAKETVEEFFEIPIGVTEELVQDLAAGLEHIFQEYITFVSSCGNICVFLFSLKRKCLWKHVPSFLMHLSN